VSAGDADDPGRRGDAPAGGRGPRRAWLAAGALLAVGAVAVVVVATQGGGGPAKPTPTPTPRPRPTATPTPPPQPLPAAGKGLAVGITEYNPNLIASPADRQLPAPWGRWRDALGAIRPAYYRLLVDWAAIQPSAGVPADLTQYQGGCSRTVAPCLAYSGITEQLQALASRQREGGWQALVVILNTPRWAASPPGGCEKPGTQPGARPPSQAGLTAYARLVKAILAAAAQTGAQLRFWSAWNEPNLPAFLSPQRNSCDAHSPSLAPDAYAGIVRTLQQALAQAPGDQQIVLGETAGLLQDTAYLTSVQSFIAGLPRDVVCASTVWSQHGYIGGADPVPAVVKALKARGCGQPFTVWITETGVGPTPKRLSAAQATGKPRAGCLALHRRLVKWWRDPAVTVAFQYEFRSDPAFPSGLVSANLATAAPALAEWTAWGGGREPTAPPPAAAC
jgi:hypothetical protein